MLENQVLQENLVQGWVWFDFACDFRETCIIAQAVH